ncbi:MAG: BamA/TamA family outer membrane protein [Mediterranea sp.]|jgi:outer membrane protein assembly factor BamA|nr:BamA/TamA family outer membrane protein [Mediterranea sp.]
MKVSRFLLLSALVWMFSACSSTKFVPEGAYLLDDVHIYTNQKKVKPSALSLYLRQTPNAKWFSLIKTQLYIYNLSGRDSTKWMNKMLRRIGDAPVIYSDVETERSRVEITKAVQNMGYMSAQVDAVRNVKGKKLKLSYWVNTGNPYIVRTLHYDIQDEKIKEYLRRDSVATLLSEGMLFDVNVLDKERQRITDYLHRNGYYRFNKEFITYTADTVRGTYQADLTMHLSPFRLRADDEPRPHPQYTIGEVSFITDYDASSTPAVTETGDSIHYKGYPIYYNGKLFLRPKVLTDNLRITPGQLYAEQNVQRTYANFGRLPVLKYTSLRFAERQQGDSAKLDVDVLLTKNKHQGISLEVEGTNSAGDLGAAVSVSYQNRNVFKGSESFLLKLRGAYEAVSGFQSSIGQDNYTEIGAETSINFPRFMFPFLTNNFRQRIRATTEFGLQYSYQLRPEFSRIVTSASWSYRWGSQSRRSQHRVDLLDINYLYMPYIDPDFKAKYLDNDQNYILKYNYEDRFILRTGYSFTYNSAGYAPVNNATVGNTYTVRFNIESAGNLLYGISNLFATPKNSNGEYTFLNIPYAQYIKGDLDFAKNYVIDGRNSLAFHVGGGIAVPYGNASVVPFEKRYFSGGANSVRGWSVRSLGPGSFAGSGNFLDQSGDIKLDFSLEYRTRLFWKFRGAVFVDAGNIWTIRNYDSQPGGQFRLDTFYKQIAVAYGVGLRLDLDFFILRFDGGMKAINPVYDSGKERYPIFNPKFGRDFAFHFAVGYPF